jgi:DNA-binding NarL/FixJ family response regulator
VTVRISVLIADDQELVRTGFRLILGAEDDLEVIGEATNGAEAVALTLKLQPDVVLMDVRMPEMDGIEATRRIMAHRTRTSTRVLMLTTFDLDEFVFGALQAGASGFLLKDLAASQVVNAVRTVSSGDALLAPSITRRLIAEFVAPPTRPTGLDQLTPRELDVFKLVARGMSNSEIAAVLIVGESTIKTHVARLLMKLGVRDRVQLVVLAYEAGVVTRQRGPTDAR